MVKIEVRYKLKIYDPKTGLSANGTWLGTTVDVEPIEDMDLIYDRAQEALKVKKFSAGYEDYILEMFYIVNMDGS